MRRATPLGLVARAAACIAAGAACTVAVAWMAQLWAPAPRSLTIPMYRTGWSRLVPQGWPRAPHGIEFSSTWGVRRWIERGDDGLSTGLIYELLTERAGWPCAALRTELQRASPPPRPIYFDELVASGLPPPPPPTRFTGAGIWPKSWRDPSGDDCRRLAVLPDWPGLAIDTSIFAAGLAGLWIAALFIRREIRGLRGCCRGCGYNLRGSMSPVCPECGV